MLMLPFHFQYMSIQTFDIPISSVVVFAAALFTAQNATWQRKVWGEARLVSHKSRSVTS